MSNTKKPTYTTLQIITSYFNDYLPSKECKIASDKFNSHYLNVMNNSEKALKGLPDYKDVYNREKHNYCHLTYLPFNDKGNYKDFGNRQYYYVTKVINGYKMSLRADLIEKWIKNNANDYVLVVDERNKKCFSMNMKTIINRTVEKDYELERSDELNFMFTFNIDSIINGANNSGYVYYLNELSKKSEKEYEYLAATWKYMGNVKYAKYRASTTIKVISYDPKSGLRRKENLFKSIKQAYDFLKEAGFDMSYKTFQRRCKSTDKSVYSKIETDKFKFYVSDNMDFNGPNYF